MPSADLWGKVDGGSSPAGRMDTELCLTQHIPGLLWDDPGAGDRDSGYIHCIHITFFTQISHRMFVDTLIKKNRQELLQISYFLQDPTLSSTDIEIS